MQQIIWPVLIAFLAVMVMGPIGIPLLKKLHEIHKVAVR